MPISLRYTHGVLLAGGLVLAGWLILIDPGSMTRTAAQGKAAGKTAPPTDMNELSMEVNALQAMQTFKMGNVMLKRLANLAKSTGSKSRTRDEADASANYRRTLLAYRDALVKNDESLSESLADQVDELRKKEEPDIDDEIDITDEARKQAPEVMKGLTARQLAVHIAGYGDNIPVPYQIMSKAMRLDNKKKATPDRWKEERAQVAREVSPLLAGSDPAQVRAMEQQVLKLLDRAYAVKMMKKERPELQKALHALTDPVGPMDVLRNLVLNDLAELLSNPRLLPAADARLAAPKP